MYLSSPSLKETLAKCKPFPKAEKAPNNLNVYVYGCTADGIVFNGPRKESLGIHFNSGRVVRIEEGLHRFQNSDSRGFFESKHLLKEEAILLVIR